MREKVMRIVLGLSVLVTALLAATFQPDDENEKKISVSECPKAVQKTLKKEVGDGKVVDVDVRTIKGVAIYESEIRLGDLEYDLVIRGDGTLLSKLLEADGQDADSKDADDDEEGDDEEDGEDADEKEAVKPVRMEDLPKAVAKTLKREARGGEVEKIEKETEGGKVVYEAEVEFETKDGEQAYEIQIAEDGKLLKKVLEADEDEDEDQKDKDDEEDEDEDEDEDE